MGLVLSSEREKNMCFYFMRMNVFCPHTWVRGAVPVKAPRRVSDLMELRLQVGERYPVGAESSKMLSR